MKIILITTVLVLYAGFCTFCYGEVQRNKKNMQMPIPKIVHQANYPESKYPWISLKIHALEIPTTAAQLEISAKKQLLEQLRN